MFDHEDLLLVYMTQTVDNLYAKTVNFRPHIDNLDDLIVNIGVNPSAISALKKALSESHQISLGTLRDDESSDYSIAAQVK